MVAPAVLAALIAAGGAVTGGLLGRKGGDDERRAGLLGIAGQGATGYGRLGGQLDTEADYMRRVARGQESVSAEQLRQALQQNVAAQQSMAAGATPQNQAMAGLLASRNAMNAGMGLAGQQAEAGMKERQMAQEQLARMLLERRSQDLSAAQFGYANAPGKQNNLLRQLGGYARSGWGGGGNMGGDPQTQGGIHGGAPQQPGGY